MFIAQLCHIEAAAPGGPRFNPNASTESRRAADNLVLLCYRHHVETDDTALFPVDAMRALKLSHERQFAERPFAAPADLVAQITREAEEYWNHVERAHSTEHDLPDLRVPIDAAATETALLSQIHKTLEGLDQVHAALTRSANELESEVRGALVDCGYDPKAWDERPYYKNPTVNRDWEWIHLGLPNNMMRLAVLLQQLEIRILERILAEDVANTALRTRLRTLRVEFLEGAKHWGLID